MSWTSRVTSSSCVGPRRARPASPGQASASSLATSSLRPRGLAARRGSRGPASRAFQSDVGRLQVGDGGVGADDVARHRQREPGLVGRPPRPSWPSARRRTGRGRRRGPRSRALSTSSERLLPGGPRSRSGSRSASLRRSSARALSAACCCVVAARIGRGPRPGARCAIVLARERLQQRRRRRGTAAPCGGRRSRPGAGSASSLRR